MHTVRRWGLFNLIGTGGFIIQMTVLATLVRLCGWHYGWASVVAIELAIVHNFIAHSHWTWRDRAARTWPDRRRTFGRYQLAKSASLAANLAITAWLVQRADFPAEVASAAAVMALSIVNFLVADALVFKEGHTAEATPAISQSDASGSDLAVERREVESCDSSLPSLRLCASRAPAPRSSS